MVSEDARLATADDIDRLVELLEASRVELAPTRGGHIWQLRDALPAPHGQRLRTVLDADADAPAALFCGTIDGVTVGLAHVEVEGLRDGRRLAVLRELYVEPDARCVGVGEALMDEVLAWAAAHHCAGIEGSVLPGNRASKNFFERYGLTARAITVFRTLDAPADPTRRPK